MLEAEAPGGRRRVPPFFFLALALLASAAQAGPDPHLRASLIERAGAARLAHDPTWHALLHYEPDWIGAGWTSEADSPGFFLASQGKTDPVAELVATLDAFLTTTAMPDEHPRCRLPARFAWLAERLELDAERLPAQPCPKLDAWQATVPADRVTLVFPAAYLNNPASMYGHTLLRLDRAGDDSTDLGSYAINFAALTNTRSGSTFAIRGLTGLYHGGYSVLPYYQKVNTYNDIENRDIWEYPLDLTTDETRFMLLHLWEVQDVWFDYYFLDENCSYQLLTLLAVARPEAKLALRFPLYAIPSDTVREVLAEADGGPPTFRPGLATRVRAQLAALAPSERELARGLARGQHRPEGPELAALDAATRAAVLDAAYELQQYEVRRKRLPRTSYAADAVALLRARSAVPVGPTPSSVQAPAVTPEQGHPTGRLEWAAGRIGDDEYAELRLRAAYHDLLDPPAGYIEGAQIEMFAVSVRFDAGAGPRLERFDAVEIASLAPRDDLRSALSWRFNFGLRRSFIAPGQRLMTFASEIGAGWAWRRGPLTAAAFGDILLLADDDLPGRAALGAGASGLLLWEATSQTRLAVDLSGERYPGQLDLTRGALSLRLQHDLTSRLGLRVTLAEEGPHDATETTIEARLVWYF